MSLDRDTDLDWIAIGESEPHYGVLSNPSFLKENHSAAVLSEFWQGGTSDIASFLATLRAQFGPFDPRSAIDFGCGVGRLTRAIAVEVDHVVGVDVSPGMLAEAKVEAPANATFQHDLPTTMVDWVVSHVVFQHIPPHRGYALFESLLARLNVGGAISVHFTIYKDRSFIDQALQKVDVATWDGGTLRSFADSPYPPGTMLMHDYDLTRLMYLCHAAGIDSVFANHTDHGGCHGVILFGRRIR